MQMRSKVRVGATVIHRHRRGSLSYYRVSELVLIDGRPKAILGWIDIGGVRTPIYICELDPAKLKRPKRIPNIYYYAEVTLDPRYEGCA